MSKRCSSCILPVNLPGLTLDQDGKCSYCRKFEASHIDTPALSRDKTRERFETLIEGLRGKGGYDCVVPLSGGKESSYILYVLVKEYNLRALAFNFSNGFQHVDAISNIENTVNRLGVDLVVYKPSQHMMRKLFKTFLLRAGEFCTPCNMLINATQFRLARQNGIKAIMSGNAMATGPGLEGVSSSRYMDRKYYLNVAKGLINRREREYYLAQPYSLTAIQRIIGTAPQVVTVLDYLQPSLKEIHDTLETIGWKRPAGAIQHGDCLLDPLKDYLYYTRWGCTEVTSLYSLLIRNGEINREEALRKALAGEVTEPPAILPEFLKNIGMTEDEFSKASKKDFRDIPNMRNSFFFRGSKKIVQKIALLRGRRYD